MIHKERDVYVLQGMFLIMISHVFQQVQFAWRRIINIMMIGKSHVCVIRGMWWIWMMENVINKEKFVSNICILYWTLEQINASVQ